MKLKTKQLLLASVIWTVTTNSHAAETNQSNNVETDSRQTNISITEQKHLQWGLTENEFSRYENLMEGVRGSISPSTISPIEVLGIHARNKAEREKYARMWADIMEKDAERILAFQRAYDQAWQEKGGDIIDVAALSNNNSTSALASSELSAPQSQGRTLTLITRIDDCTECDQKLQSLLNSLMVDRSLNLDVYFSDSAGKENSYIRQWAVKNNISPSLLKQRRISLNHGGNVMKRHQITANDLPVVFK